jgi:aspartyl-tRNA(Asn)/glutamyl-tRNA(Gln) amidotransferase subunit A
MAEPLTIAAAAPLIRSGELTPSELLEQCLRRIDVYEPAVKAWVYLDRERARRDAARLTKEATAGRVRGPLHGIPVGVKDIIDVFDMPTGCGSKLWANSYARRDATVVERLRQAGAVILGKTVTTPYAYLDPPPTRNPWDLSRTPGGSSSGSAAAVACGMCLAALGTQTGGSTIRPASYCGVYALKPTHDRISRDGVLPLAPTLDHVGLMAHRAADLAAVFAAVVPADAAATKSTRFVIAGGMFRDRVSPEVRTVVDALIAHLRSADDEVAEGEVPVDLESLPAYNRNIYAHEAAGYHADRYFRLSDDYPRQIAGLVLDGIETTAAEYAAALAWRRRASAADPGPGVFLMPATVGLPPDRATTGSPLFNTPWSFLGWPAVSVPVGWSAGGLPVAVQLAAGPGREADLLAHAAAVERVAGFDHRFPPVPG